MVFRPIQSLNLLIVLVCSLAARGAWAAEPVSAIDQLPANTMVALRVSRLDKLDTHVQPLAEKFGLPLPGLGQLAASFDGVDAQGELLVGLVQMGDQTMVPYMLLPVTDYKAFVHAGDGDAGIEVTPLTLLGEELMATRRGDWALVTNPLDSLGPFAPINADDASELRQLAGTELVSLLTTRTGVEQLKQLATARSESTYQKANRYRILQRKSPEWTSSAYWQSLVSVYSRAVERCCTNVRLLVVAVDVGDDLSAKVRVELPQASDREMPAPQWSLSSLTLANQRVVVSGEGPWGSPWTSDTVELYLDHFEVSSRDVGINYLRPKEFADYRASVTKVSDQVHGAQLFMIAPAKDQPVMSNSAALLLTDDSKQLIESLDAAVKDWNHMVELSQREVDLYFGAEPLEVGSRTGKRFTLDLTFGQNDVPDVRTLMAKLYGRNGIWAIDVLPVDDKRVLITDLPDELRSQLLVALDSEQATPTREPQWVVTLNPNTLQTWFNDCKRAEFGEEIIGWKPIELECDSNVVFHATTHNTQLTLKADVPADVLKEVAKLWNQPAARQGGEE